MNTQTILVLGATGKVGRQVVKTLVEKGVAVKAFVRDRAKAQAQLPAGVALVEGDLESPASLGRALSGVHGLFLSTPNAPGQVAAEKAIIDAAVKAGVAHLVKLSGGSAHEASPVRIARWHGETERYLEASGIPYTHLQPEFFMQNLLGAAPAIAEGRLALPLGVAPMGLVDVRDIAAVAASVLTEGGHEGKTYPITGPQVLTMPQIAGVLTEELGRPVVYEPLTAETFIAQLRGWGVPDWSATALAEVFVGVAAGNANFTTDVVAAVGKVQPHTFREFVGDHRAVFVPQGQPVA